MKLFYKHTQTGYTALIFLAAAFFLIAFCSVYYEENAVILLISLILLAVFALFFSLTITVDEKYLNISFGIGLIKKRFLLEEIQSFQTVRNAWYYGWGIRLTPHGWLYNVSGLTAIQIILKSGKKYRIGTDNPNDLEEALEKALKG